MANGQSGHEEDLLTKRCFRMREETPCYTARDGFLINVLVSRSGVE